MNWKKVAAVLTAVGLLCGVGMAQPYIQGSVSKFHEQTPSITISTTFGVESTFLCEPLLLDLHLTTDVDVEEDTYDFSWTAGGWLGWSSDQGYFRVGMDYGPDVGLWVTISWRLEFGLEFIPQTEILPSLCLK